MAAGPASLVDLLRESTRRFPDRPAILLRGVAVSYGELWQSVCRAANVLRAGGLAPGERVALLIENSPEYVIA
ncbi:MAG TPA: AMP-binding protein, partial [Steroidobacteraceae bacterium]|nr:AMP-binding protein [Steroidobacteraceae bacterium]